MIYKSLGRKKKITSIKKLTKIKKVRRIPDSQFAKKEGFFLTKYGKISVIRHLVKMPHTSKASLSSEKQENIYIVAILSTKNGLNHSRPEP